MWAAGVCAGLLHDGECVGDDFKLKPSMELQLVLSVGASSSFDHQEEVSAALLAACERRDVRTACLLLQAGAVAQSNSGPERHLEELCVFRCCCNQGTCLGHR